MSSRGPILRVFALNTELCVECSTTAHIIARKRCQKEIPGDLAKRICMDTTAKIIAAEETSSVCLLCAKTLLPLFCTAKFANWPARRREKDREKDLRKLFAICFTQFPSRTLPTSPRNKLFSAYIILLSYICNIQICSAAFKYSTDGTKRLYMQTSMFPKICKLYKRDILVIQTLLASSISDICF